MDFSTYSCVVADGMDETLIPLDYKKKGQITDDVLYEILVKGFKKGVYATFLIDCCHSGSVMDLPFVYTPDKKEHFVDEDPGLGTFRTYRALMYGCLHSTFCSLFAKKKSGSE